jgi:hypothetical protein
MSVGHSRTVTPSARMPVTAAPIYAQRARDAHAAMAMRFERRDGMLRRDGLLRLPGAVAHLWPLARALVADLDVAGIPGIAGSVGDFQTRRRRIAHPAGADPFATVLTRRLAALERYWDERGPAYASDPPVGLGGRIGGDIYHDDNAWVGLALVALERRRPGLGRLDRAAQLAAFARADWDDAANTPSPGGVFWVQQGRGIGTRNHDRNAISTAPNAQLILWLEALGALAPGGHPPAQRLHDWVAGALTGPGGLIRDKIRGDGTIDEATWTYNQGSMIGLRAQLGHLAASSQLATCALNHYGDTAYAGEPGAFVAIFMRNLLVLHARSDDAAMRARITATLRERADAAWAGASRRLTLLEHSAVVSLQALAAWDPADYGLIS